MTQSNTIDRPVLASPAAGHDEPLFYFLASWTAPDGGAHVCSGWLIASSRSAARRRAFVVAREHRGQPDELHVETIGEYWEIYEAVMAAQAQRGTA